MATITHAPAVSVSDVAPHPRAIAQSVRLAIASGTPGQEALLANYGPAHVERDATTDLTRTDVHLGADEFGQERRAIVFGVANQHSLVCYQTAGVWVTLVCSGGGALISGDRIA